MKDHTDKRKKYICDYCSKAWDRPSDLVKHNKSSYVQVTNLSNAKTVIKDFQTNHEHIILQKP